MSNGSNRIDKDYYNENDFDEMIAGVIEPTKRSKSNNNNNQQQDYNEYEQDQFSSSEDGENYENNHSGPMVDTTPTDAQSTSDQDDISLNSDDISGGSDISDVEQQRRHRENFTPRPLINDDESTVDMRPPAPVNQSVSSYVEALNQQQTRKNRIVKFGVVLILAAVVVGVVFGVLSVTGGNKNGQDISGVEDGGGEDGRGSGLESGQISVKEGFMGNATTDSPSLSPVYFQSSGTASPASTMEGMVDMPTKNPTLPPQSALPTTRPSLPPVDVITTDAPAVTESPATPDPTPLVSLILALI